MAIATRATTRSAPVSIAAATTHLEVVVGPLDDEAARELRRQMAWVSQGPRRSLQVDLRAMADREVATVLALVSATAARARAIGNEVHVVNLAPQHRRDARGFGLRCA